MQEASSPCWTSVNAGKLVSVASRTRPGHDHRQQMVTYSTGIVSALPVDGQAFVHTRRLDAGPASRQETSGCYCRFMIVRWFRPTPFAHVGGPKTVATLLNPARRFVAFAKGLRPLDRNVRRVP